MKLNSTRKKKLLPKNLLKKWISKKILKSINLKKKLSKEKKLKKFENQIKVWNLWSITDGLAIKQKNMLDRRSDLTGVIVRAATLEVIHTYISTKWFTIFVQ